MCLRMAACPLLLLSVVDLPHLGFDFDMLNLLITIELEAQCGHAIKLEKLKFGLRNPGAKFL